MTWIKKADVVAIAKARFPLLSLDEKTVMNWAEKGRECPLVKVGARLGVDDSLLNAWLDKIEPGVVTLTRDDYVKCFQFGVEAYYQMTRSDFNRGKKRDAGEFITNQTQGKLGEIALERLLNLKGVKIELDFRITGQVASQDIQRVSTRTNVWDNPRLRVSIKSSKLKNLLLAIPEGEATLPDRRSDIYVLSLVGLFDDHLLRVIKENGANLLGATANLVPPFEEIPARVSGWVLHETLTGQPPLTPDQQREELGWSMSGNNYIFRTGQLSNDWDLFKQLLLNGRSVL